MVRNLVLENEKLLGKLSALESKDKSSVPSDRGQLYSQIVMSTEFRDDKKDVDNVVMVHGLPEVEDEEARKRFLKCINPLKDMVRLQTVQNLRNGGLVVTLASDKDKDRLLENTLLEREGLKLSVPVRRRPRLLLTDVPRDVQGDDLLRLILELNKDLMYGDRTVDLEEFKEHFKLLYRTGKKRKLLVNWIIEVSPEFRKCLLRLGRLYIEYRSCQVKDYYEISKCYCCQLFGHIAKYCRQENGNCYKCGEQGHQSKDFKIQHPLRICIPCRQAGRKYDHFSREKVCSTYHVMLARYKQNIDYG
ncbi:uncharacterized protein LOC111615710 [Centruroides sculpturatus]|uniref:uncharacterized protein LOC111615710 n=1 Tax=Centruroides sculpturatus TaxID=218467 RepID=UPI000C6D91EB|nr:uncharacterized protein LOC111615710 [Centruroides sculpturatus]